MVYRLEVLDTHGIIETVNEEIKKLKDKMTNLDVAKAGFRLNKCSNFQQEAVRNGNRDKVAKSKPCELCDETFVKTSDLETHLKEVHEIQKRFKCTECNKGFALDWRRKKHLNIHTDDAKFYHFYNNKITQRNTNRTEVTNKFTKLIFYIK